MEPWHADIEKFKAQKMPPCSKKEDRPNQSNQRKKNCETALVQIVPRMFFAKKNPKNTSRPALSPLQQPSSTSTKSILRHARLKATPHGAKRSATTSRSAAATSQHTRNSEKCRLCSRWVLGSGCWDWCVLCVLVCLAEALGGCLSACAPACSRVRGVRVRVRMHMCVRACPRGHNNGGDPSYHPKGWKPHQWMLGSEAGIPTQEHPRKTAFLRCR